MLLLIFPTDSDVIEIGKNSFEVILIYKLHHFPLKKSHTISDSKWQPSKLVEVVSDFKGCIGLILIFEQYLMVGTAQVSGAKNFVLSNVFLLGLSSGAVGKRRAV